MKHGSHTEGHTCYSFEQMTVESTKCNAEHISSCDWCLQIVFTLDNLTLFLSLFVCPGPNQPRATDNPELRACFVKSR